MSVTSSIRTSNILNDTCVSVKAPFSFHCVLLFNALIDGSSLRIIFLLELVQVPLAVALVYILE